MLEVSQEDLAFVRGGVQVQGAPEQRLELAAIAAYSYATPVPAATTVAAVSNIPVTGNTEQVGWLLYTSYLIPFEIASMLLLVAMIGAIILAKREL